MTQTRMPFNRTVARSSAALLAAMALVLAGCSSEAEAEADADEGQQGAQDDQIEDDADGAASDGDSTPSEDIATTAEDGWADLHHLDIPDPGTVVMDVEGDMYTFDITCTGPGVYTEENSLYQFKIGVEGNFTTDDGRDASISLTRYIQTEESFSPFYDYEGLDTSSVTVTVEAADAGWHSSIIMSPADDDSAGAYLPLFHAAPDGSFTVQEHFEPMMMHDEALRGNISIAGKCSAPWDELD